MFIYSCNDTGYEIQEHELTEAPKTETKPEIKQDVEQPKSDIKQEINREKKVISKQYTIQIGAFSNETNAIELKNRAGKSLNFEVTYVLINGLYKVRAGEFTSKSDAISNIEEIVQAGYKDPFITELNK